jgi:hypothetical protein
MRIIKSLVVYREKTGLNRKMAIQECISIIDTIFEYEEEFGFKSPISIRVLGQGKSSWITEKALNILNTKIKAKRDELLERELQAIEDEYEINLERENEKLEEIIRGMEEG